MYSNWLMHYETRTGLFRMEREEIIMKECYPANCYRYLKDALKCQYRYLGYCLKENNDKLEKECLN